jgi:hypothetical protein
MCVDSKQVRHQFAVTILQHEQDLSENYDVLTNKKQLLLPVAFH